MNWLLRAIVDDDGTTAVEYAVMLALIIAACITAVSSVGSTNDGSLKDSMNKLGGIMGGAS
jgi:pilus assembly protein Flp/PilA